MEFDLKSFLLGQEPKVFLVGAGCSVDPPSCLQTARVMMDAMIRHACPEPEVEQIRNNLSALRFEALVELFMSFELDPDLKLIDYYGECDKPNLQHYFLAGMIKHGHCVLTTNFDYLIEHALVKMKVDRNQIIPVITKTDYKRHDDPTKLHEQGKYPVYKIHGAPRNVITGENTRSSLIATLKAFGTNKEGLNLFQIEPFKAPLFNNIERDNSLVVMGYSGSDDFDIIPTLKSLRRLRRIVWFDYIDKNDATPLISLISETMIDSSTELDKTGQLLAEIKSNLENVEVYRVDTNLTLFIKELVKGPPPLDPINFKVQPEDWLLKIIEPLSPYMKYFLTQGIYESLKDSKAALRCAKEALRIATELNDPAKIAQATEIVADICSVLGDNEQAQILYERTLKFFEQQHDEGAILRILINLGTSIAKRGQIQEGLHLLHKGLRMVQQRGLDKVKDQAAILNIVGGLLSSKKNYAKALESYDAALGIVERDVDMQVRAAILNNIITVYLDMIGEMGKSKQAIKLLNLADTRGKELLEITSALQDRKGEAHSHYLLGVIYARQGRLSKALEHCEAGITIAEQVGITDPKIQKTWTALLNMKRNLTSKIKKMK